MPSGSRAIAPMNSRVTPAVAMPSTTPEASADLVRRRRHGRPITRKIAPAQTSRSHAVPSAPRSPIRSTDTPRPICTVSIEHVAIRAPVRALLSGVVEVVMGPVKTRKPFAST